MSEEQEGLRETAAKWSWRGWTEQAHGRLHPQLVHGPGCFPSVMPRNPLNCSTHELH